MSSPAFLSEEQKLFFVQNGYVILPGIVSPDLLSTANSFIDSAPLKQTTRKILGEDLPAPRFDKQTGQSPEITDLLFKPGLFETVEDLLGDDLAVVTGNKGHLDIVQTCDVFVERGMKLNRPHPKKRWKVWAGMGKHAKKGAGYSVLVSVCLTQGLNEEGQRGQMVVWPGSHFETQKAIADTVRDMNEDDDALKILHHEKERAECGDPLRLLLNPGDVLIAHQKIAIGFAPNLVEQESRHIGFRIAHALMDDIIDQQVSAELPWVGFKGLAEFLDDEVTEYVAKVKGGGARARSLSYDGVGLTTEQRESFIRDGFVIISGAIPQEKVSAAVELIDGAYAEGKFNTSGTAKPGSKQPLPGFIKPVKQAPEILDLMYESVLFAAAEDLLGKGNVILKNKVAQIGYTTPSERYIEEGMDINDPHPKFKWHVDAGNGKYAAVGSDFSLLMGVCLSDGQQVDENRGQFTVWRGSHTTTHTALSEIIENTPANDIVRTFIDQNVDVGEPERALLHPGDAFIAHQRLAHAPGINLSNIVRKNVYFRVMDRRIDMLMHDFVHSPTPWVGFDGLKDLLPEGATLFERDPSKKIGKTELAASSAAEDSGSYDVSDEQKESFVRDGYVVLPEAIPMDLLENGLKVMDRAFEKKKYHLNGKKRIGSKHALPAFTKNIKKNNKLRDLFFKSGLVHASEQFLGEGHVTLRENLPEISYLLASEMFIEKGMDMEALHPKNQWTLDRPTPDYKGRGADSNFLIGIALSDGQDVDENRGQINVWPGSHLQTHIAMSEALQEESPTDNVLPAFRKKKLALSEPKRVLMQKGDAVLVHQRTAMAQGINLTEDVRKVIFFRVVHVDFDEMLEEYSHAKLPFVGYDAIQDVVANVLG